MNLYEAPPNGVELFGRRYRLDLRFDQVLRAMDILADETLLAEARVDAALRLFVRGWLPRSGERRVQLLDAIARLLNLGKKETDNKLPSFSLTQDAGLIRAAFRQAYGIDLRRANLHWFEFLDLLGGLPGDTQFSHVVEIRERPLPEPNKHNGREIAALLEAKSKVALVLTQAQQESSYAVSAAHMAQSLMALAKAR